MYKLFYKTIKNYRHILIYKKKFIIKSFIKKIFNNKNIC